jgi:hypothetical protein
MKDIPAQSFTDEGDMRQMYGDDFMPRKPEIRFRVKTITKPDGARVKVEEVSLVDPSTGRPTEEPTYSPVAGGGAYRSLTRQQIREGESFRSAEEFSRERMNQIRNRRAGLQQTGAGEIINTSQFNANNVAEEADAIDSFEERMRRQNAGIANQSNFNFAGGGSVQYRAGGGSIFQPKGTDTVPAMLTPGEFVIKKSAVDNIGVGNLQALNRSNGGAVQYRQGGGPINSAGNNIGAPAINIPTGDQFKAVFRDAATSLGKKRFFKVLTDNYEKQGAGPDDIAKILKSFTTLQKAKRLDVTKLKYPNNTADYLDRVLANSDILKRVDAEGVTFKNVDTSSFIGNDVPSGAVELGIQKLLQYRSRLTSFTSQGTTPSVNDEIAAGVIKDATGQDYLGNLETFQKNALGRVGAIDKEIARLQNVYDIAAQITQGMSGKDSFTLNTLAGFEGKVGGSGGGVAFDTKGKDGKVGGKKKPKDSPAVQDALGYLSSIGAISLATGGSVPGFANGGQADTVPAMLTPGEFVMSRESVQKHGVGYMKNLNRGRIPGFNRGGVVGRGNVQYKQDGGLLANAAGAVLGIDPSKMQGVLDTFSTAFSATVDSLAGPFSGVVTSLDKVANAFGSMHMTHEFTGNISMSVNIGNKDAIIEAVKKGITAPDGPIAEMITKHINASIREQEGRAAQ